MIDASQLPYILQLLDEENPSAQREISRALASFGPGLDAALEAMPEPPTVEVRAQIRDLLAWHNRDWLREHWYEWHIHSDYMPSLEAGLGLLAQFQSGAHYGVTVSELLDGLAAELRLTQDEPTERTLAQFLFQEQGFSGSVTDYYSPYNSNLVYAIQERRGLPITLTAIYMLVGYRLGLHVEACALPGHFIARIEEGYKTLFVDGFAGGNIMDEGTLVATHSAPEEQLYPGIREHVPVEAFLSRVLRNLSVAYERIGAMDDKRLMEYLMRDLRGPE